MLDRAFIDRIVDAEAAALASEAGCYADMRRIGGEKGLAECRGLDLSALLDLRDAAMAARRARIGHDAPFWRERGRRIERVLEVANAASFELGEATNFPPGSAAMGRALGLMAAG